MFALRSHIGKFDISSSFDPVAGLRPRRGKSLRKAISWPCTQNKFSRSDEEIKLQTKKHDKDWDQDCVLNIGIFSFFTQQFFVQAYVKYYRDFLYKYDDISWNAIILHRKFRWYFTYAWTKNCWVKNAKIPMFKTQSWSYSLSCFLVCNFISSSLRENLFWVHGGDRYYFLRKSVK